MRRLEYLVAFAALLGLVLFLLAYRPGAEPSLVVTGPSSGDTWQPGETHMITWKTDRVPASDNISVTIRRIPPPPLQQEGQEFDPVVFTQLPNSGSASWQISPMYPDGTYVLGVHAYKQIPITDAVTGESGSFSITHPKLAADLYPLYSKADWQGTEVESFTIGSTSYSGTRIVSYPIEAGMDPGSILTPFEKYYDQKLKALGWRIENGLAAGGHVGGQTGYEKGSGILVTRFQITYRTVSDNAPSECPCSVTLSLFSQE